MKKLLIIIFAIMFIVPALTKAQEEETIFGGGPLKSGGYGAPEVKFTIVKGDFAVLVGGRGGWIINSTFSIGGGGYGLVTNHDIVGRNDTLYRLRFGYGGAILEYINSSNKSIHFTINTLIGAGSAASTNSRNNMMWSGNDEYTHDESTFFVVEPGITMDINLFPFMRFGIGASWRIISGLDIEGISSGELGGPAASLCIKFGKF